MLPEQEPLFFSSLCYPLFVFGDFAMFFRFR